MSGRGARAAAVLPFVLTLERDLRPRPWGGARLGAGPGFGEAWLAHGASVVADGPDAGRTLDELAACHGSHFVGTAAPGGRFPFLAKVLDPVEWLSIQVHPSDEQAASLAGPGSVGKHEAWHVLETGPAAALLLDPRPDVTPAEVVSALGTPGLRDLLQVLTPRVDDRVDVPPGAIHAVGPDVLVYEIQQPSDLTYRVDDWGRPGRELHLAEARVVVDGRRRATIRNGGLSFEPVAASPHFRAWAYDIPAGGRWIAPDGRSCLALTVTRGAVRLTCGDVELDLEEYATVILAARGVPANVLPLTIDARVHVAAAG